MSLTAANLSEVVKKQYFFKLKANIDAFSALVGIQLLAILFSMGGANSFQSYSGQIDIRVGYFSADVVIAFSMIWALVTGITITTRPYRNQDFTFVTNRLSSNLANILFLFSASIIGGVTAMLARSLPLAIRYMFFDVPNYILPMTTLEFLLGTGAAVLYLFCISAIGYFIGSLVQISKLFVVIIPALLIGMLFLNFLVGTEPYLVYVYQFYIMESSIGLFIFKMAITTALFFIASIGILNRMEVRR
ncbi:hypothetical protein [Cytobacillus depressus]|nr:hypothetical protein [Cytobacillus depressus]